MIDFLVRHAGWVLGIGVYLAVWILIPDVDVLRRTIGSFVLSMTILIVVAGWEYGE